MLVVVAIFLIITGILLTSLPSFRDSKSLDLVAQEIATIIRQVQVFSLGSKTAVAGGTSYSHGIYFTTTQLSQFTIFNDKDNSRTYSAGDIVEEIFKMPASVAILSYASGGLQVFNGSTWNSTSIVDLTFQIPLTEPIIRSGGLDYPSMRVKIRKGASGGTRTITINQLGQVSITNP